MDSDGIKDYSFFSQSCHFLWLENTIHVSVHFLAWTNDRSTRSIVGFSTSPSLSVRLPAGDSNVTMVYLSVRVRDQYGCSFEFDIPPVSMARDTTSIAMLINALQSASSHPNATSQLNSNEIVQLLLSGNQNQGNQVLVSLSQVLNTMSNDALQTALMSTANIPATALSVSSLDRRPWILVSELSTPISFDTCFSNSPTPPLRPRTPRQLLPNTSDSETRWRRCWTI